MSPRWADPSLLDGCIYAAMNVHLDPNSMHGDDFYNEEEWRVLGRCVGVYNCHVSETRTLLVR